MNQRIKELMGKTLDEKFSHTWTTMNYQDLEKFSEHFTKLIMAETISVLQKRFMGDLNREDMEVRRCIADVKAHFGVEE
jgi:hypothetical protein